MSNADGSTMFDRSKADALAEKLLGALNLGSLALMASIVPGLTERLAKGIWALDVGRGSGRILNRLAELYPNSRFVGIDVSPEAIGAARDEASWKDLGNVRFAIRDLSDFDVTAEPEAYDMITTFDAIHDQAKLFNVLLGSHRAFNPMAST